MENAAKLIAAVGALLGAIAWPIAVLTLGLIFRKEIRRAFDRIPALMDRMRKMKIAGVEAELDRVAAASAGDQSGSVTPLQIEAAAKIAVGWDDHEVDLLAQLDRLCLEYDSIRRTTPASSARTQAMTRIIVKMRTLSPALVGHIEAYKGSGSPGSRLAAVAMMQMNPSACDVTWLAARFENDQPFIFYHAALALQNLANNPLSKEEWDQLIAASQRSLDVIKKFTGEPDPETVSVLERLIEDIRGR